MSKKTFKSQASSSRAFSGNALTGSAFGFGAPASSTFSQGSNSVLSYVYEPPDLTSISDPAVGVSFKNLQKKDSITKFKALEDLQSQIATRVERKETLDDVFLEAWSKLFPRTSIDNSGRVRQSAYTLHGKIASLCGKSFVKYLPLTVGAWLAGTFDREIQVSRAARNSIAATFGTEEKRRSVWKVFQESILDYCLNAIQKETLQTLSDERTSSPDDAQAKYSRAIGGALLTLSGLLDTLSSEDLHKHASSYEQCLQSDSVWKLTSSADSGLRRAVYRLAVSSVNTLPGSVDLSKLGNLLIKQLSADQTDSATDFIRALTQLNKLEPQIWTTLYTGPAKKSSSSRLISFLSKGSYGVGSEFYKELSVLLDEVPIELITADINTSENTPSRVLTSLRDAITGNAVGRRATELESKEAWQCFLSLSERIMSGVADLSIRGIIVNDSLLPIVKHHVEPSLADWGRNWPDQKDVVQKAFSISWKNCPEAAATGFEETSNAIVEMMQISLPEQSKDFKKSQDAVIATFTRWYNLQRDLLRQYPELGNLFSKTAIVEIQAAIGLMEAREGKPYSGAAVLELLVTKIPQTSIEQPQAMEMLQAFAKENIPRYMQTASAPILLKFLDALGSKQETKDILDAATVRLLAAPRSQSRSIALQSLALSHWPSSPESSRTLEKAILDDLDDAMKHGSTTWALPVAVLISSDAPEALDDKILNTMLDGLSIDQEVESTISGFHQLVSQNSSALQVFASSLAGSELLSRLLYLSHQGSESVQSQSSALRDAIGAMVGDGTTNPIASIIQSSILKTGRTALPISTLWVQAESYLKSISPQDLPTAAASLIPDVEAWRKSLQPFLEQEISPTLALMDSLGGAVYFISSATNPGDVAQVAYDTQAYSAPLRAAIFAAKLLKQVGKANLENDVVAQVYNLIILVNLMASDNLGLTSKYPIFHSSKEYDELDTMNTIDELRNTANSWITKSALSDNICLSDALQRLLKDAHGQSPSAYHHARAYVNYIQGLEGTNLIPAKLSPDQSFFNRIRKSPQLFTDFALMASNSNPASNLRLFNELVSDLSAAKNTQDMDFLQQIVTLNILLKNSDIDLGDIPKQRLVYFVKSSVTFLESEVTEEVRAEFLKALAIVIPALADIYDEFWESIIQQAIFTLSKADHYELNVVYAALQIYSTLEKLMRDDPNEDLQEAWTKHETDIVQSRLTFLENQIHSSDTNNQPLRIVYELLYRQLSNLSTVVPIPLQGLYPVMRSDSTILHRAVYQILEKGISAAQEQVSLEAALTADYVPKLPQELLALLLELPHEDDTLDLRTRAELPAPLSSYLLGWKLVLSHWNNASYKVRAAYVADLKQSSCVDQFLTFCFTSLIDQYGGRNRTGFDPSRLPSITTYELNNSEDPEREYLWLLCNIYYGLLLHAPHVTKSWHTNACPRALKSHVEDWTSKHMSPLIIAEELRTVAEWKPPSDDPKSELAIKISPKACEITASLPLDETSISIKVHLPPSYPLASIDLTTDQRVGIDEKKWRSYLNVSLIMMNFSSTSQGLGSVIDGISAWRTNVLGALKGHTECAICYSVVAEDGKVPNKKCSICSHTFHGLCLFKWFQRSAGSSCPLCRNAFNYA